VQEEVHDAKPRRVGDQFPTFNEPGPQVSLLV
jgi:hypothetical protein